MNLRKFLTRGILPLLLGASISSLVCAQRLTSPDWPTKPIRLIVPFAAGGGVDLMARITAQQLSAQLGQPVVVENQTGAGGTIASANVSRAAADGHTLIFHSVSSAVINAVVLKNLPYDPVNGFTPVSLAARFPQVLVVSNELPVKNLPEFLALLRANPGKYSYGSGGTGTVNHIAGELFKSLAKVDMTHVPYKGAAAALQDLLPGRLAMLIDGVPPQLPFITSGKLKVLAVTTLTRSDVLPQVPTLAESGLAGYDIPFWTAIFAPAGTPQPVVERLATEMGKAMKNPDTVKRLAELGAEGVGSSPSDLNTFWRQQLALYGRIVKDSGIKLD